jgi:aspartate/glutamate racemase
MKTLGLTGGTSWYSTVDYYRYVNEAINDAYGNGTNPRRKMDLWILRHSTRFATRGARTRAIVYLCQ